MDGVERREVHIGERQRRTLVPVDAQLEDPECDRGGSDDREAGHAAEQECGQRAEEDAEAQHRPDREPEDPSPEERRRERQERGDRPDQRLQALHRDTEQRGAVGAIGRGADRHAEACPAQEPHQSDHGEGRDDECEHAVSPEDRAPDLDAYVERVVDPWGHECAVDAEPARQEDRQPGQQLGEADGRDRQHETRGGEEAPDDRELDEAPKRERCEGAGDHGERVRPAPLRQQQEHEDGRRGAEVALGEVDDPVRAVDERHAERDECGHRADERPADEHAEGKGIDELLEGEDRDRWCERGHPGGAVRPTRGR